MDRLRWSADDLSSFHRRTTNCRLIVDCFFLDGEGVDRWIDRLFPPNKKSVELRKGKGIRNTFLDAHSTSRLMRSDNDVIVLANPHKWGSVYTLSTIRWTKSISRFNPDQLSCNEISVRTAGGDLLTDEAKKTFLVRLVAPMHCFNDSRQRCGEV